MRPGYPTVRQLEMLIGQGYRLRPTSRPSPVVTDRLGAAAARTMRKLTRAADGAIVVPERQFRTSTWPACSRVSRRAGWLKLGGGVAGPGWRR